MRIPDVDTLGHWLGKACSYKVCCCGDVLSLGRPAPRSQPDANVVVRSATTPLSSFHSTQKTPSHSFVFHCCGTFQGGGLIPLNFVESLLRANFVICLWSSAVPPKPSN